MPCNKNDTAGFHIMTPVNTGTPPPRPAPTNAVLRVRFGYYRDSREVQGSMCE